MSSALGLTAAANRDDDSEAALTIRHVQDVLIANGFVVWMERCGSI